MNILNIAQIIAGIGTFLTSMISLFTLIEMKQQRRASMMPGLFINKSNILYILRKDSSYNGNNMQLASIWSKKADISQDTHFSTVPNYKIELFNVGIGTAVNVEYEWEFDVDAYVNMLQEFNISHDIIIEYRGSNYKANGYAFNILTTNTLGRTFGLKNSTYKLAFLPSSQSAEIQLPGEFTALFNLLVYSWLCPEISDNFEILSRVAGNFDGQNILKLHIYYNDIGGKKYKKSYSLSLSAAQLSFPESEFYIETSDI